jgi:hypothetical protein
MTRRKGEITVPTLRPAAWPNSSMRTVNRLAAVGRSIVVIALAGLEVLSIPTFYLAAFEGEGW